MSLLMDALKKAEKAKQDADKGDSSVVQADVEKTALDAAGTEVKSNSALEERFTGKQTEDIFQDIENPGAQTEVPVDAQSISLEPRPDLDQANIEQTIITPAVEPKDETPPAVAAAVTEPAAQVAPVEAIPVETIETPTLTLSDNNSSGTQKIDVPQDNRQANNFFTEKKPRAGIAAPNMIVAGAAGVVVLLLGLGGYSYYQSVSSELKSDINRAMDTVRRQQGLAGKEQNMNQVITPAVSVMPEKPASTRSEQTTLAQKPRVKTKTPSVNKSVVSQKAVAAPVKRAVKPVVSQAPVNKVLPEQKTPPIKVKRQLLPDNVYALLSQAYSAYQIGDDTKALSYYTRVLEIEFNNRDALLGLAAISVRNKQYEKARDTYLNLIENNPRDSVALSGLLSIQSNVDPDKSETQIKLLLDKEPGSSHLLFTLGSLYASQQRWAEAQDLFFKAYSSENNNADYAYNLAVSLDQLEQRGAALRYYRTALELVKQFPVTFSVSEVMGRINVLQEAFGG